MKTIKLKLVSVALLTVVASVSALVSTASADEILRADADDTPSFLDIHQLTAGHGKGERLQHSITTFEKWSSRRLGHCSELYVQFPDAKRVITIFRRRGELRARMVNPSVRPLQNVSHPQVWRRDVRTVVVSFHRDRLGDVGKSYEWRAVTRTPRGNCPEDDGSYRELIDVASKRHGSYIHRF